MSKSNDTWIPASTPPKENAAEVIVMGGKYAISQAVYISGDRAKSLGKEPGFYIALGGGVLAQMKWVEWWIYVPRIPESNAPDTHKGQI